MPPLTFPRQSGGDGVDLGAAVVVGGNPIGGGLRGSVTATIVGALFLTYLGQLVLTVGFDRAMQDVVKAAIIILGVALPGVLQRLRNN